MKILIILAAFLAFSVKNDAISSKNDVKVKKNGVKVVEKHEKEVKNNNVCIEKSEIEKKEEPKEDNEVGTGAVVPEIQEEQTQTEKQYRLTSYYPGESSDCTGSGICSYNFDINDKGWYLYDGKIVLAAATTYLQSSFGFVEGKDYYKYYEEVDVTIDGVVYRGVILDSCGACMKVEHEERLDLFVSSANNVIDKGYGGNNPVMVRKVE